MIDLSVNIAGVKLANPLMTASGTCGYADEYADFVDLTGLGAFVTKSITLAPRPGNDYPRIVETRAGILNAIGLANIGLEAFCAEKVPLLERLGVPVFVNVAGASIKEYVSVIERLDDIDSIAGVELNISCPNVSAGGIQFGTNAGDVSAITAAARKACRNKILIVKLSPNVTDIAEVARAAVETGADALSLVNTFTAMVIDIETARPVLANRTGGLSGPAIRPIAVYMIHRVWTEVARDANVPIIGMGGLQFVRDAIEFLLAGATGLAVGTATFVNPACLTEIRDGIAEYLRAHDYSSVTEIIGAVKTD
ncbi:MAG: dihydroorotate dehydrogenase [Planctomycetota bacterium]|nr:dihydroorotate dehydrogenase [Planctomycetota bacterium]